MRKYLFVDGGCLRASVDRLSKTFAGGRPLEVDFKELASGHEKAFYYDAIPQHDGRETEVDFEARLQPVLAQHRNIRVLDGYHVYEGDLRRSASQRKRTQKKVDVLIAVDMLTHTFRRNMDRATLLASDLDFAPLLNSLVLEGMYVELWYPATDTHADLVAAADARKALSSVLLFSKLKPASQKLVAFPSTGSGAPEENAAILGRWEAPDVGSAVLKKDWHGFFVLEWPHEDGSAFFGYRHLRHRDLDQLKAFAREMSGIDIPMSPS